MDSLREFGCALVVTKLKLKTVFYVEKTNKERLILKLKSYYF
jgi:hypothetical protein